MRESFAVKENRLVFNRPAMEFQVDALLSLNEADRVLFESFGQGPLALPRYSSMLAAIENQMKLNPKNIAAHCGSDSITYGELDRKANYLASCLISDGVQPGDNVGLFVRRSIPMLVGIVGILKAGAAYVPQDVKVSPTNQLRYVAKAANTTMILTLSEYKHLVPISGNHKCLSIDEVMQKESELSEISLNPIARIKYLNRSNVCFVLFTSGTTGHPNGVNVTHGNLCNILLTEPGNLGMKPGVKVSQILNIAFDMAAWEILGALSHGATLVIRDSDFEETVKKVDVVIATPSILGRLDAQKLRNVKIVAVAGEPCPKALANEWSEFATFYNSCGPTEVTIVNTMKNYSMTSGKLTIGKPTPNNTVYILNENMKPCKIGEIGEMWAGGDCISSGYIQNEKLTNERYKPDPFLGGDRMMFRTRDLGRWTVDGELEHFGRTDDQVKIRGFRVELDSVSTVLESGPDCLQAVTLKLDNENLVSFVRPSNVNLEKTKSLIGVKLPYYCTPSLILAMDEFPKTDRGKIDKRALTIMAVEEQEKRGAKND